MKDLEEKKIFFLDYLKCLSGAEKLSIFGLFSINLLAMVIDLSSIVVLGIAVSIVIERSNSSVLQINETIGKSILNSTFTLNQLFLVLITIVLLLMIFRTALITVSHSLLLRILRRSSIRFITKLYSRVFDQGKVNPSKWKSSLIFEGLIASPTYATIDSIFAFFLLFSEITFILALVMIGVSVSLPASLILIGLFCFAAYTINKVIFSRTSENIKKRSRMWQSCHDLLQERIIAYREVHVLQLHSYFSSVYEHNRREDGKVLVSNLLLNAVPKYALETIAFTSLLLISIWQIVIVKDPRALEVIAFFMIGAIRVMPSMLRIQGSMALLRNSISSAGPALFILKESISR